MRSFYYYLGTGKLRESSWFRPLQDETSIPLVDWNDDGECDDSESVYDQNETMSTDNMEVDPSSQDDSEDNENKKAEALCAQTREARTPLGVRQYSILFLRLRGGLKVIKLILKML
jgi:hypothetical protein